MKSLLILALVAAALARPEGYYDEKYDNFNVDEVIENERLFKSYALCLEGEGKCTAEGNNLKKQMPEAIQTKCEKCSPKQKKLIAKMMKAMMEKLPDHWEKLYLTHDPEKKAKADLEAFLAAHAP